MNSNISSIAQAGWTWWKGELSAFLPKAARAWLSGAKDHVSVFISADGCHVINADEAQAASGRALDGIIGADLAIKHSLTLPIAAKATLRQAVSYEIDRISPFAAEDVLFDCRVFGRASDDKLLNVDVHLVPKKSLEAALATPRGALSGLSIADFAALDVETGSNGLVDGQYDLAGLDLSAPERLHKAKRSKWTQGAAFFCILVAFAFLLWSVWAQQNRTLSAYEDRLTILRAAVNAQEAEQAGGASKAEAAAEDYASARVPFTLLLDDVTGRLGNDTFLFAIRVEDDRLTLSGASKQAAELLTQLDASPYLRAPAFSSPIIQDPKTGYERFNLTCQVVRPKPKVKTT